MPDTQDLWGSLGRVMTRLRNTGGIVLRPVGAPPGNGGASRTFVRLSRGAKKVEIRFLV